MRKAIKVAMGAGWRAGMAKQPLVRPGGTRGIKHLRAPLNPYSGPFCKRWRPLLALAWDQGLIEGMTERLKS